MNLRAWFLASRPKTLTAALIPVLVATSLAYGVQGKVEIGWAILAFVCALLIQIATNFFNDAIDFLKGSDSLIRLGPKRMAAENRLQPKKLLMAAAFLLILCLFFALPILERGGWPFLVLGSLSVFLTYFYTGGPYPLSYKGLGEVFVFVFFGLFAVMGSYYLQTLEWSFESFVLAAQVGLFSCSLIAINNLRDFEEDRKSKKNTMAVRLGVAPARFFILLFLLVPYVLGIFWLKSFPQVFYWTFPLITVAVIIARGVYLHYPCTLYNRLLALAAAHQLLWGILFSLALTEG